MSAAATGDQEFGVGQGFAMAEHQCFFSRVDVAHPYVAVNGNIVLVIILGRMEQEITPIGSGRTKYLGKLVTIDGQ